MSAASIRRVTMRVFWLSILVTWVAILADSCGHPVPAVVLLDPIEARVDEDAVVAHVLAGSRDGWTTPECWDLGPRSCPPRRLAHTVRATAEWAGVSPTRIARLIWVESRADSAALGPPIRVWVDGGGVRTRAVGLGQIVPELWLGVFPECGNDLRRVRDNVCYTVMIWRYYRERHHPDVHAGLLAYNGCRSDHCQWYADAIMEF